MNQQIVHIRLAGSPQAVAEVAGELEIGLEVIDDSGSFACRRDKTVVRRCLKVVVSEIELRSSVDGSR
ncbi:MAG: hypothetical protein ACREP9_16110 [Candidatus Dormibacteraceae bacterium]